MGIGPQSLYKNNNNNFENKLYKIFYLRITIKLILK